MTAYGKSKTMAAAAITVLLFAAAVIVPAAASTLTVFKGPACAGKSKDVNSVCGCFSINGYPGGYHFVFTEKQRARLYTTSNCQGGSSILLTQEKRVCGHHNFKSVRMIC